MHEVRTEHRHVLLEARKDRLADTKCLELRFIRAGEQMLIARRTHAEFITKTMWDYEMHRSEPLR
jgi:hypothetical protein